MTSRIPTGRARALVAASTAVLAALLFVACGGSTSHSTAASSTTGRPITTAAAPAPTAAKAPPTTLPDVAPTAADFVNINTMARVGDHFLGSLNGHLAAVLAVARSAKGGVYPVGSVIQLLPTEAMVKRREGYSPSTGDWEFFALQISAQGTEIANSGPKVKNFSGADCASCHSAAAKQFDFVCGTNHGCPPLGLTDAEIALFQQSDPRPKS